MAFPSPIFDLLPLELQEEIIQSAKIQGAKKTARDYCDRAGMSESSLYQKLIRMGKNDPSIGVMNRKKKMDIFFESKKKEKINKNGERTISRGEKMLLNRFENGEVSIDEVSRKIARIAFENILANPASVKYADFIKTEMLKLKQEEGKFKEAWGKELLQRVFAGKLPPAICPNCGYSFMSKSHSVEGEVVITDEPESLPESL